MYDNVIIFMMCTSHVANVVGHKQPQPITIKHTMHFVWTIPLVVACTHQSLLVSKLQWLIVIMMVVWFRQLLRSGH